MADCRNCIHKRVCDLWHEKELQKACSFQLSGCDYFQDRSRFVEAPCEIGSTIYMIVTKRSKVYLPEFSFIKTTRLTESNFFRVCRCYGKTVFLSKAEAETALAERSETDANH